MASRSDKLFQKHKAQKSLARREPTLSERQRALIVCEGKKTEPQYLRALVEYLGLTTAQIEICGDCDSAPVSVVNHGINKFDSDPDFDFVFFVFDRDTHGSYDEALRLVEGLQAKKKYKNQRVEAITSIPCFEFWYLLHFGARTRPYTNSGGKSPCGNLISELKKKARISQL